MDNITSLLVNNELAGVRFLTTAPTADNPDDFIKFVVLSQEPATKYEGYFYIILEG